MWRSEYITIFLHKFHILQPDHSTKIVDLFVMKKGIITYFLLSLMLIQLLPLQEMGQLLYNNQLTEEICDGLESAKEHSDHQTVKKITEDEFLSKHLSESNFRNYYTTLFLMVEIKILSRVFDDTLTPPPLV